MMCRLKEGTPTLTLGIVDDNYNSREDSTDDFIPVYFLLY
jgi:hypothetical protein